MFATRGVGRIFDSYANHRLRLGFASLSRILPTSLLFTSCYANTGNVFCCLNIDRKESNWMLIPLNLEKACLASRNLVLKFKITPPCICSSLKNLLFLQQQTKQIVCLIRRAPAGLVPTVSLLNLRILTRNRADDLPISSWDLLPLPYMKRFLWHNSSKRRQIVH